MEHRSRAILAVLAACACAVGGCASHGEGGGEHRAPDGSLAVGGFASPETVVHDPQADVYLVSNVSGEPNAEDDDGFVSRVAPDGRVVERKWIAGGKGGVVLHGPKGMILKGDTLFVADVGAVRAFDRRSGAPLRSVVVGSPGLNDLALGGDGTVYVSDLGPPTPEASGAVSPHLAAVYALRGGRAVAVAMGAQLDQPDGILPDGGGLLVATFGGREVYRLAPDGARTPFLTLPTGRLDGLLRLPDSSLLVSSWDGKAVYRVRGGRAETVLRGVDAPAQIGYDARRGRLLVPSFSGNELLVRPLR